MKPVPDYRDKNAPAMQINFIAGWKPIYKFLKRERMAQFFDSGSIRLGTLHNFRQTEVHGLGVGDEDEGRSTVRQHVPYAKSFEPGSFPGQIVQLDGGAIVNCTFYEERNSENAYTFCASHSYSEAGFEKWHETQDYDACYEIFDPIGFGRAVSRALRRKARFVVDAHVIYVDGHIHGESDLRHVPPALIKQSEGFDWQTEYRWLWEPLVKEGVLEPEIIVIQNPRRFCRPVAFLEAGAIRYVVPPSELNSLTGGNLSGKFQPTT